MMQCRRVSSHVRTSARQSSTVYAKGTSEAAWSPLRIASRAIGVWSSQGVQMRAKSATSGRTASFQTSAEPANLRGSAP